MKYKNINKVSLGFFPTPLVYLSNLSKKLGGPKIYIKRDDQSGLAFGGNKTRKLEFILGDALAKNADTVITAGAAQSNHCRQSAAAAAKLGLECHLVLGGEEPQMPKGNLLLDKIFGAHIHWAGKKRKGEDIPYIEKQLKKAGKNPYIIPYGGSNELGATGFVEAFRELVFQQKNLDLSFEHIVFASSSGGTHAGLMVGKKIFESSSNIIGINIDKGETGDTPFEEYILSLANKTVKFLDLGYEFTEKELILNSDYTGEGYGVVGDLEKEAISLLAKSEGILLDPVYTGRAMGGLVDMISKNRFSKNDKVLFWHTGGTPALFA